MQLEADRFAVEKGRKGPGGRPDQAPRARGLHQGEERSRSSTAAIETAKAHLKAQQSSNELECKKLALIEDQIEKCIIRAPCDGQVVYANVTNSWGDKPVVIEAGATVRERQVIIKLPDRNQIQVKARINESKIALVTQGMPATIRLDALPDVELRRHGEEGRGVSGPYQSLHLQRRRNTRRTSAGPQAGSRGCGRD